MKTFKSFFQQLFAKRFKHADLQGDKNTILGLIHLIVFITSIVGGTVMYFYDMNSFLSLFLLGLMSIFGWLANRAGHPRSSAVILLAALLITIQYNIFAGFGIHDVTIIAWPAFIFFSGLLFGWQIIPYVTALIMILAVVTDLVPNAQFETNYSDTGDLIVMLLILLAFSLIAISLLRSNEHLLQRLKRSDERFRAIYNSINDAIIIQDSQTGAILDINEKTSEMFGYTLQEISRLDILALRSGTPPYEQDNPLGWIGQAVVPGAQRFERQVKDKSGRLFWVDVNMKLASIAGQTQILVSVRDITERKRAEETIEENREKYHGLSEASFEAIFISEKGICLEQNQMAELMFGYSDSEAIGRSGTEWILPEDREIVLNNMLSGYDQPYEVTALRKDGSTFPVIIRGKMMHYKGRTVRVTSMSDITARKRAEQQQEVLFQVHRAVSSQLDADHVLHSAVETIVRLTGYPHVCIALQDGESAHWIVRGAAGSLAAELGAKYPIHQGVIGRAFSTGQVQWVPDILEDPDYVREVSAADAPALRSELVAPLRRGERLFGALNFESDHADAFNEADVKMIQSVADIIALALDNARLYEESQQEITVRKQAEKALRESHQLLVSTFASMRDAVFIIDANTTAITDCNPAATEIFGYSREDMLGKATEFLHVDQAALDSFREHLFPAVAQKGFLFLSDFKMKRRDGTVFPTEHTVMQLNDEQSNRIGWVSVVRDITDRKRAEQALRENEEKYRRLFDNSSLGIFRSTPAGQVISINPAFARMLGYDSTEDAIKSIQNVATDLFADPNRRAEIIRMIAENPDLKTFENVYRRKDGSTFIGQLNLTPIRDAAGRLVRTEGMIEDITVRKQAEAKIRATLEEKETLLREVHHRVKNNLQAMIALIEMQAGLIPDETTRLFLKELEGQARTMALIYEQLYQSVNLARVQMTPYLQQLTNYISDTFGGRLMVQLTLDIGSVELDVAQAMPCGLIVNELFTNIFKHAFPPGFQGQPLVHITLLCDGETFHLIVADNGVGLPPGYVWQASQSLGLRLVNLWATHQLGGTLNVSGDPGTTFAITFPKTSGYSS